MRTIQLESNEWRAEDWHVGCDSPVWLKPRRTVYFVWRDAGRGREVATSPTGRTRHFRSFEAAKRVCGKLNHDNGRDNDV